MKLCYFAQLFLLMGTSGIALTQPMESSLESSQKRIKDHLILKDYSTAVHELKIFLAEFPQSKELQILMIKALADSGQGPESYKYWKQAGAVHPELLNDLQLIETIAWATLAKAEDSSQYIVNISSIIGVSLTRDAKAVAILQRHLHSNNAYFRMLAVKVAAQYGDKRLIEEIQVMLKKETVWYVRLEILRALGALQLKASTGLLKEIIADSRSGLEERAVAAEALVVLYDHLDDEELQQLLQSKRAGLRYLACEIVSYLNLHDKSEAIAKLLDDPSAEVRIAALNALTMITIEKKCQSFVVSAAERLLLDVHPHVAITAARLLAYYHPEEAVKALKQWVSHENQMLSCMAAYVLALSGDLGKKSSIELLKEIKDPFIQLNLAYGLLREPQYATFACSYLAHILSNCQDLLMFDGSKNPVLNVIVPSRLKHTPEMAQYPMAVDQHIRLHVLNKLAMMRYPNIEESIRKYLKSQTMGMTYIASSTLLEEGAEDSIDKIRELLSDEDEKIRMQAALVLAMVGADKKAIQVLKEVYGKVDRETKGHILEAFGHIGSKEEIPFLMERLDDPFNIMKVIAASSIIQCIYH